MNQAETVAEEEKQMKTEKEKRESGAEREAKTGTERTLPGIMIAAPKSGSGKTIVTCAMLQVLKERGICPAAFKCGPDYIDPLFHREVIGVPSRNLDSYFAGEEMLRTIYGDVCAGRGIAVAEGVMGLFDGLGGISERGSAYEIASILNIPILLVVDAHGMGRSIVPLISGFLRYDRKALIRGVILNRMTGRFYESIAPVIEAETNLPVLGYLPERKELHLESRHLGLRLPGEIAGLKEQLREATETFREHVRVEEILRIARMSIERRTVCGQASSEQTEFRPDYTARVRIGVARDEAFCFYYEENLRMLEKAGAELVFFSPLHDERLPEGISALVLGGGYPEVYARELEANGAMRVEIKSAIALGMPSVAECGGFLYLHDRLTDDRGKEYAMCGVLPGKCFYTGKLVRFGYIELQEKRAAFLPQGSFVRGHEFHYYDSEINGRDCRAEKPITGKTWECAHVTEDHFWGFAHLYYPSCPEIAEHLIRRAKIYQGTAI